MRTYDPPEPPEAMHPCPECDQEMEQEWYKVRDSAWICKNPECPRSPEYNADSDNPSETQARAMLSQRTTYQLVLDWEEQERRQMTDVMPIVRGWLMDELEKRNKAAFDCWLESSESSPRKFFVG